MKALGHHVSCYIGAEVDLSMVAPEVARIETVETQEYSASELTEQHVQDAREQCKKELASVIAEARVARLQPPELKHKATPAVDMAGN